MQRLKPITRLVFDLKNECHILVRLSVIWLNHEVNLTSPRG